MSLPADQIRAIAFDYGNTLIQFTRPQIERCDAALVEALVGMFGPVDPVRVAEARDADRLAPYSGEFRENDLPTITANLVTQLYGSPPTDAQLEQLLDLRFNSFVDAIEPPDYVVELLDRLGERYRLALASNYPCSRAIRASLERCGLADRLDPVVVSGDIGYVKPHARVFATLAERLELEPGQVVFVGDNWLGDIQGARRAGMFAVHTLQWDTPEKFDREPDHLDAHLEIRHLTELADHLL